MFWMESPYCFVAKMLVYYTRLVCVFINRALIGEVYVVLTLNYSTKEV
jgi:hypothetical protein